MVNAGKPGPRLKKDPHADAIKARLAKKGHTLKSAAESQGMSIKTLCDLVHHGITLDPRSSTVERLKALGIYKLVQRRVRKTG